MDELLSVLTDIRDQLFELNSKIDSLTSFGVNDISDIVNAVNDIKGSVGYDLTDVCDKLDSIESSLGLIDSTLMMKD